VTEATKVVMAMVVTVVMKDRTPLLVEVGKVLSHLSCRGPLVTAA
jgi:hypothetical protein